MHYLQKELYKLIQSTPRVFDFLQECSLDGLWFRDLVDGEAEWTNERFWSTLGYQPDEFPFVHVARASLILPDDRTMVEDRTEQHLNNPEIPYDQIVRYLHKSGRVLFIRCRGIIIRNEAGKPIRLLGGHVDLNEAKKREALLEEINHVARIGVWELSLDTNRIWWSDTTKLIHGVGIDYEPNLEDAINFYKAGKSRDTITELVKNAAENGEGYDAELLIITAQGREVWVRAVGKSDKSQGGTGRLHGVLLDIDQHKRGEEKLFNYGILEAKSKEMEQFAYAASHDLREPLLTISGYVDVIEEDYSDQLQEDVRKHLKTIREAAEKMDGLIKGLLDYTRLSELKQLQEVDMNDLLQYVLTDLSAEIMKTNAAFEIGKLPTLQAYPLELKVLLQSLIGNAIKFRREGVQPLIKVHCRPIMHGYEITIADNGIGIDKKYEKNVFLLFRKLNHSDLYSGAGIGLANVKKIVELHNGSIRVEKNEHGGASFSFTLCTVNIAPKK